MLIDKYEIDMSHEDAFSEGQPNLLYIKKEMDKQKEYGICPDCEQKTIRAKGLGEGGGVECINPNCDYWFCY